MVVPCLQHFLFSLFQTHSHYPSLAKLLLSSDPSSPFQPPVFIILANTNPPTLTPPFSPTQPCPPTAIWLFARRAASRKQGSWHAAPWVVCGGEAELQAKTPHAATGTLAAAVAGGTRSANQGDGGVECLVMEGDGPPARGTDSPYPSTICSTARSGPTSLARKGARR